MAEASPGPWMWEDDNKIISINPDLGQEFGFVAKGSTYHGKILIDINDYDALLIAKSPEYITYLLQLVETQHKALVAIEEELADSTSKRDQRINIFIKGALSHIERMNKDEQN